MATQLLGKSTTVQLPVSLEQIAVGLRKLSRRDLATLEVLLDPQTMKAIERGRKDVLRGKVQRFRA